MSMSCAGSEAGSVLPLYNKSKSNYCADRPDQIWREPKHLIGCRVLIHIIASFIVPFGFHAARLPLT